MRRDFSAEIRNAGIVIPEFLFLVGMGFGVIAAPGSLTGSWSLSHPENRELFATFRAGEFTLGHGFVVVRGRRPGAAVEFVEDGLARLVALRFHACAVGFAGFLGNMVPKEGAAFRAELQERFPVMVVARELASFLVSAAGPEIATVSLPLMSGKGFAA